MGESYKNIYSRQESETFDPWQIVLEDIKTQSQYAVRHFEEEISLFKKNPDSPAAKWLKEAINREELTCKIVVYISPEVRKMLLDPKEDEKP